MFKKCHNVLMSLEQIDKKGGDGNDPSVLCVGVQYACMCVLVNVV